MPSHRRRLAIAPVTLALLLLAGCGFSVQTDQVYQPATGTDNRDGSVYVLNALVVSGGADTGRLVASMVNENQTTPDKLLNVTGPQLQAASPGAVLIPAGGLVNLATGNPITVTGGGLSAGKFVTVTFAFANSAQVTMLVPVVDHSGDYAGIPVGVATPSPSSTRSASPTPSSSPSGTSSASPKQSPSPSSSPS